MRHARRSANAGEIILSRACDPHVREGSIPEGVFQVTLDELLSQADLVSLHVNLSPETHGFFSRRDFAKASTPQ